MEVGTFKDTIWLPEAEVHIPVGKMPEVVLNATPELGQEKGWGGGGYGEREGVGGAVHACHHCTAAVSSLAISVSFISTSSPLARVIIVSRSALKTKHVQWKPS